MRSQGCPVCRAGQSRARVRFHFTTGRLERADRLAMTNKPSQRVLIAERRLTHYRVPLYERMRDLLEEKKVNLKLVVGTGTSDEIAKRDAGYLPWATALPTRYFLSEALC